jgi:hypothetical protein
MSAKFDFGSLDAPFEADWPVTVNVPKDGGETEPQTFMARLRLLTQEELDAAKESEGTDGYIASFFVGFGQGETTSFSPELLAKMIRRPYVRVALMQAFRGFQLGIAAKN